MTGTGAATGYMNLGMCPTLMEHLTLDGLFFFSFDSSVYIDGSLAGCFMGRFCVRCFIGLIIPIYDSGCASCSVLRSFMVKIEAFYPLPHTRALWVAPTEMRSDSTFILTNEPILYSYKE